MDRKFGELFSSGKNIVRHFAAKKQKNGMVAVRGQKVESEKERKMKMLNRGYILITPKEKFVNWTNLQDADFQMYTEYAEGNVYLIEEDFLGVEPIVKANFKKIFENELRCVSDDEKQWPEKLTYELFEEFFDFQLGSTVFDLLNSDLK